MAPAQETEVTIVAWVLRGVIWLGAAASLSTTGYLLGRDGYNRWEEAGLCLLAAILGVVGLLLPEAILARLPGTQATHHPATASRGTRVLAAQDLLRKGFTPVPDPISSVLGYQLQLLAPSLPIVLEPATVRPMRDVLDSLEEVLRCAERTVPDQSEVSVKASRMVDLAHALTGFGLGVGAPAHLALAAQILADVAGNATMVDQPNWRSTGATTGAANEGGVERQRAKRAPSWLPLNQEVERIQKQLPARVYVHT